MQALIFKPTKNHARISGYARFASVKRMIPHRRVACDLKPLFDADGGLNLGDLRSVFLSEQLSHGSLARLYPGFSDHCLHLGRGSE